MRKSKGFPWLFIGLLAGILLLALIYKLPDPKDFLNPRFFPKDVRDYPKPSAIETAISRLKITLESEPDSPKVLVGLGVAYFGLGREHAVDALNALEKAKDSGALDKRVFYYLGRLYGNLGLTQFAAAEYEKFLRHEPKNAEVKLELAKHYYELGSFTKCAALYEELLDEAPRAMAGLIRENLVLVSFKLGDWEKTKVLTEDIRRRNKKNEANAGLSFYLAQSLKNLDQCEEALPVYEEALTQPLEEENKLQALEGKLSCLMKAPDSHESQILETARALHAADRTSKMASAALKKYRSYGKKKT